MISGKRYSISNHRGDSIFHLSSGDVSPGASHRFTSIIGGRIPRRFAPLHIYHRGTYPPALRTASHLSSGDVSPGASHRFTSIIGGRIPRRFAPLHIYHRGTYPPNPLCRAGDAPSRSEITDFRNAFPTQRRCCSRRLLRRLRQGLPGR